MPEVVVILAGDSVGDMKELNKVSISSSSRESVLLSKAIKVSLCVHACTVCEGICVCVGVLAGIRYMCSVCE